MILRFALSGSIVFETTSDCVPPAGATVTFAMQTYKKGFEAGTVVTATVTDVEPSFDYTSVSGGAVMLDLDRFVIAGED